MKENTGKINILITSLICVLVILCFTFLRIDTSDKQKEETPSEGNKSVEIYRPQLTEQKTENEISKPLSYTVKLENNTLNFYMNSEKDTVLLESAPINTQLFPEEDIKSLSESITVTTLEEGISLIEDFTS